jgi:hypothetical protein
MKLRNISYIFIALFILALYCVPNSLADSLNGTTYPIVEPNLLTEMQQRAKKIDVQKLQEEGKLSAEHYFPKNAKYLPPSQKSYDYLHDVVYTLPFNIPKVVNGKVVGILYPKGYTYHVLQYIPYDFPPLVFFSIKNPLQREWIAKYYGKNLTVDLLTVDGDLSDILKFTRELKRPVYASDIRFVERFGLKYTVSIVRRSKMFRDDVRVDVIGMQQIKKELKK